MMSLAMLAQYSQDSNELPAFFWLFIVAVIAFAVVSIIGMWKMYEKAGQPGWASIIPIYNLYILLVICGKPWWWLLIILFASFIPFVGGIISLVFQIMVYVALSKSFGHGVGFAIGLIFLYPIFVMILGFGESQYVGAEGAVAAPPLPNNEPPLPPPDINS